MQETSEEVYLQGLPVSDGIAIGTVVFLEELSSEFFPVFSISASQVDHEIHRYRRAIHSSRKDLERLQYSLATEGSKEAVTIINSHIQMLEDPIMTTVMEEKIGQMLHNTEHVFRTVIADYEKQFNAIEDEFFRQRFIDVKDLSNRILHHLHPIEKNPSINLISNKLVFTEELIPSLTAESSSSNILGFVTRVGGGTSHAALIARAKGISYVSNVNIDEVRRFSGALAIINGNTGEIVINPSEQTLERYEIMMKLSKRRFSEVAEEYPVQVKTKDNIEVDVWANVEDLSDLNILQSCHIGGVGLLRSEFLYAKTEIESFSEEDQMVLYGQMFEKTKGLPVNFRVFDVGGDKNFSKYQFPEPNPALGCRSIRFLLRHPELFKTQIRALLKVAAEELRLLLPLITDVVELREAKAIIYQVKDELKNQGLEITENLKIGSMIEIPSAVMLSDQIAKESDFLSIGTNDLVQYTLAADRGNPVICDMYKPAHPSILRMIRLVVQNAEKYQISVSVCGEVASNPLFTKILLGLGIRHFSCPPRYIPLIKETIMHLSVGQAEQIANLALTYSSTTEVNRLLTDAYCFDKSYIID
jgi:phosphotransferase system enzyme I (PtsI)